MWFLSKGNASEECAKRVRATNTCKNESHRGHFYKQSNSAQNKGWHLQRVGQWNNLPKGLFVAVFIPWGLCEYSGIECSIFEFNTYFYGFLLW